MRKEMNVRKMWAAVGIFCMAAGLASAVLVDNFESYSLGGVDTVTGGAWVESPTRTSDGFTIADNGSGNQVLSVMNTNDGQNGVYGVLDGDEIVAEGQTKTLFTQFYLTGDTGTYDVSFGLSAADAPTGWGNYGSYFTIVNGNFNVRQGGGNTTVGTVTAGQWYYVWMVVDNLAHTHDVYLKTVAADASTADMVADDFGQRTVGGDLDRLFAMTNWSGSLRPVLFDNVEIRDGVDLAIPEPATMLMLGLGGLSLRLRKRQS